MATWKVTAVLVSVFVIANLTDATPIRHKVNRRFGWRTFPTTTYPTTTITREPIMCHVNGEPFRPGQVIDSNYDMWKNHCSSTYCNDEGRVVHWENWNCITTPTPSPFPTTTPPTTTTVIMTSTHWD